MELEGAPVNKSCLVWHYSTTKTTAWHAVCACSLSGTNLSSSSISKLCIPSVILNATRKKSVKRSFDDSARINKEWLWLSEVGEAWFVEDGVLFAAEGVVSWSVAGVASDRFKRQVLDLHSNTVTAPSSATSARRASVMAMTWSHIGRVMSSSNERRWLRDHHLRAPQAEGGDGHLQRAALALVVEAEVVGGAEAVEHHLVSVNPIDQTRVDRDGLLISCGQQEGTLNEKKSFNDFLLNKTTIML